MTVITADTVLEITRIFDATPERVFDAWLQKSWGEWAGPPTVKGELTVSGTYKEIVRPSRIVMSWKWTQEEQDTLITLTFRPKGNGTELRMRHEGFSNADRRDSHNNGWNGTLDKLEAWLRQ
jgi:uncharacterized protein YndB with AHSA1/START domain